LEGLGNCDEIRRRKKKERKRDRKDFREEKVKHITKESIPVRLDVEKSYYCRPTTPDANELTSERGAGIRQPGDDYSYR
jgi:hypothetical protein